MSRSKWTPHHDAPDVPEVVDSIIHPAEEPEVIEEPAEVNDSESFVDETALVAEDPEPTNPEPVELPYLIEEWSGMPKYICKHCGRHFLGDEQLVKNHVALHL